MIPHEEDEPGPKKPKAADLTGSAAFESNLTGLPLKPYVFVFG
jgi:hypothetical protein